MGKGRNNKSSKKTGNGDQRKETGANVPDVHVPDAVGHGRSTTPGTPAVIDPFEDLLDLRNNEDNADDSGDGDANSEEGSGAKDQKSEGEAAATAGDNKNDDEEDLSDPVPDDEDDGYLSDDSDEHLEPASLTSALALKRFSLTLLVPIFRKAEVKRAADLTATYFSGNRYGRLQVTFNHVRDANYVWNQVIKHECVNGDIIDLTWQFPEDARFLRECVMNPLAQEVAVKGVPAEITAELVRHLLVVSKLVKHGRSAFAYGFGFHRTLDPVTGLDTDRIRGLVIPHADDEYRWRYFVEDPTTKKRYLLHYPSLTCELCSGPHLSRYHDRYIIARHENFTNWNLTVKKVHEMNVLTPFPSTLPAAASLKASTLVKRIMKDPAVILTSTGGMREEWVYVQTICEKAQGNRFEQAAAHVASTRHKGGLHTEGAATRASKHSQKMAAFKKDFIVKPAVK
ncbi:unnamed protein product [Closterium sp. NIES-65]|nr:unnamed protein product [Closterium sp. NIES-65]